MAISHPKDYGVWLLAAVMIAAQAQAEPPEAVPLLGAPFSAELTAITSDGQLTFRTDSGERRLALSELVRRGECPEPEQHTTIVLVNGGMLVAEVLTIDKHRLVAESETFGHVQLPLDSLAGILFKLPWERTQRDLLFERILSAKEESDRLLLQNGDEISGLIEGLEHGKLELRGAVGARAFETSGATAIVFNPALRRRLGKTEGLQVWAGLADGSRLLTDSLTLDSEKMTLDTLGQRLSGPPRRLVFLQTLSHSKLVYLSDIQPSEFHQTPFLELPWPYASDRNVAGGWLRCGGKLYLKGLGVHAAARLVFALSPAAEGTTAATGAKRFEALIGLDDSAGRGGSVRFRVLVDGQEKYLSPIIHGGEPPQPVSVALEGGKRLELVVDFADRGDVLDRAVWLDARLTK